MVEFRIAVSPAEARRLREFVQALRTPCQVWINPHSSLNTPEFEAEFRSRLLAHHSFIGSPLFQESFDSAFLSACSHIGLEVQAAPDGQRFWDATIDHRNISLKSSKAKNLREGTLHISKLTEAAWIQDCRSAMKRRKHTFELFRKYCSEVHAIIQLRFFQHRQKYELVEIPVSLFTQILDLETRCFSADGPTIDIPVGQQPPDFTLKIDRSDAKITITNVRKELCVVHGTWIL